MNGFALDHGAPGANSMLDRLQSREPVETEEWFVKLEHALVVRHSTIRPALAATIVHRSAVATPESSRNAFAPLGSGRQ